MSEIQASSKNEDNEVVLMNIIIENLNHQKDELKCNQNDRQENQDNDLSISVNNVPSTNSSMEELQVSCEKDISEMVKLADPFCPTTVIQRNDVDPPSDDGAPKVILNLASSSHFENNETEEEKKIAQGQLDELKFQSGRNKRRKQNISKISFTNKLGKINQDGKDNDIENDDLIAILEGKSDGHYEVVTVLPSDKKDEEEIRDADIQSELSADDQKNANEKNQAQVIPSVKGKRGRKRKIIPNVPVPEKMTPTLLNTLASDWSDNEKETEPIIIQTVIEPKRTTIKKKNEEARVTPELNKPRRIIKKKIIWDPDAPETHFPLASLVHASVSKKQQLQPGKNSGGRSITPKKMEENAPKSNEEKLEKKEDTINATQKRQSQTPVILNNKKKKLSETDKLLNDEGVSNMLSKLEIEKQAGKNSPKREVVTKRKIVVSNKKDVTTSPKKNVIVLNREAPILRKQNTTTATETIKKTKTLTEGKESPLPKKRIPKPKKDNWDFVYNQRNMDSMIIRRRSSSYSSTTSPRRLSLEHLPQAPAASSSTKMTTATRSSTNDKKSSTSTSLASNKKSNAAKDKIATAAAIGNGNTKTATAARTSDDSTKGFEFIKPEIKQSIKKETDVESSDNDIKSADTVKLDVNVRESPRKSTRNPNSDSNNLNQQKMSISKSLSIIKNINVTVRKYANVIQLIVQPKSVKIKDTFNCQILKELTNKLEVLAKDDSCKVVVMTSSGSHFCQGIDMTPLNFGSGDKRKNAIEETTKCVRDFLKTLVSFPKPLVAGVHGDCYNLGVTMLPLFDIVVSSSESTFQTLYSRIGQIPEGHCIFTFTNNIRHNFKTKLLWLCETMNATEAALAGLVTKLTQTERLKEDTLACARKIAGLSSQTFYEMKQRRFKYELSKLLIALDEEEKILAKHWASTECQEKIKQICQKDDWSLFS